LSWPSRSPTTKRAPARGDRRRFVQAARRLSTLSPSPTRDGAAHERLAIGFPIDHVAALVVTHVHIDHVGRVPYLLAAGFTGPVYASEASAILLPLVIEDALEVGVTRNRRLIEAVLERLRRQLVPLAYGRWQEVPVQGPDRLAIRLKPAGHILGSAYVECRVGSGRETRRVVFSGDLGAPYAPLLPAPRPPYAADVVVLESTYGDRRHEDRERRVSADGGPCDSSRW